MVGADYELLPEFVVGLNYTHRKYTDFLDANFPCSLAGRAATPGDFVLATRRRVGTGPVS